MNLWKFVHDYPKQFPTNTHIEKKCKFWVLLRLGATWDMILCCIHKDTPNSPSKEGICMNKKIVIRWLQRRRLFPTYLNVIRSKQKKRKKKYNKHNHHLWFPLSAVCYGIFFFRLCLYVHLIFVFHMKWHKIDRNI